MPFRTNKSYKPPKFLFNKHLETIYPALFRKVNVSTLERERLELKDGDFLDLDWSRVGSRNLVIVNHGLEGNSTRPYMLGMVKKFNQIGFDVLAWNFRGCGGEMNRHLRFYHSGETEDMHELIMHTEKDYDCIALVGFSLGGNIILKYLGENTDRLSRKIRGATVFSVPTHLESSCRKIMKPVNMVYEKRFLGNLKAKVMAKSQSFPEAFDLDKVMKAKNIMEFDNYVTAPTHGYKDAQEYYEKNSSLQFLESINIPTLLISSKNDPMLSGKCYPEKIAGSHSDLHFEKWNYGGHVGYFQKGEFYSSEIRAAEFIQEVI